MRRRCTCRVVRQPPATVTRRVREVEERPTAGPQGAAEPRNDLAIVAGAMPVLVSYVDRDLHYVFANAAYETWFRRSPDAIVGRHARDVLGDAAFATALPRVQRALGGETVIYEARMPYRDAGTRAVRVQLLPDRSNDGAVVGLFSVVEDLASTGRVAGLLDALPDGVIVVSGAGTIVACNRSAEQMIGAPAARLIGSEAARLFQKQQELPADTLHTEYPVFEVMRDDGTRAWLGVVTKPLGGDDDGSQRGTLLCLTDVTERKLAAASFDEALSLRDLISEASNDAIWDWDLQSDKIWWSEGLRAQFGHITTAATDREWWLGKIHPAERQSVKASWLSVFQGGSHVWLREFRFEHASGTFAHVICRGHIGRDDHGRPLRMFGAMQDVSLQRRTEDDLHQSEELSRAVLSSLSARIGVLDREGTIIEVNDDWRRFERDDRPATETRCLLGADYVAACAGLESCGDDVAAAAQAGLRAVLSGARRRKNLDYKALTQRGERSFSMHVEPLRTERGGAVVSHVETTLRRFAEDAEIRRLAAEQSERAKTDLINVVSHELRTPLAVIRGHVTTVLEYEDRMTELRRRTSLEAADAAAQQLERLVTDLITMGKIDAGVIRLDRAPYPLGEIVEEAVQGVGAIANQPIEIDVADGLQEIEVDRSRIVQVLFNALDNARKYGSPDGPIRIEARNAGRNMVSLVVENAAPGMRQADVENIFDRFYRTERGIALNSRGAGLGLSICKGIVEAHEGRIRARVRKGIFQLHVTLPKISVGAKAAKP